MHGETVVVIGGSSGIGLATASAAQAAGASVVITGRSQERLDSANAVLGGNAQTVALDCTDEAGTEALFAGLDGVDHVLVTAGGPDFAQFLELSTAQMRSHLDTRLWGAVYAAKFAAPKMTGGGSITFCTASTARPNKTFSPLAMASCGAVGALTRSLALQLAPIRVNTLLPGFIETPLIRQAFGDQAESILTNVARQVPAGRAGSADEAAHAVLFLMENCYVTGTTLLVDGGLDLS